MVVIIHQAVLMLPIVLHTMALDCENGWFGEGCRYKCHCFKQEACAYNGDCGNVGCGIGYFGPGCQYVNLVNNGNSIELPEYLQDNNDATCNPESKATFVQVTLVNMIRFTWIRLHVDNLASNHKFFVKLNGDSDCHNMKTFTRAAEKEIDISCEQQFPVTKVRVEGSIAAHICSFIISGGRNVALKQQVWQSSNSCQYTKKSTCQANNAVNGIRTDDEIDSCSQTEEETSPNWEISYSRPHWIYSILIYNANGSGFSWSC